MVASAGPIGVFPLGTKTPKAARIQAVNLAMLLVSGFVALMFVVELSGSMIARGQRTFYVLKSKPDFAVVRMYGDLVVAAQVDLRKGVFTGEYMIGKLGDADFKLNVSRVLLETSRPLRQSDAP